MPDGMVNGKVVSSSGSDLGDGGTTNYTSFAADGELTLNGTARVITQIGIANANLGKGGTVPTQVILGNYNGWEFDINDDSVFTFHVPHDWAVGTDITICIDWYCDEAYGAANGEIRWQANYSAIPHDATELVDAPGHTAIVDTGDIDIPANAKELTQDSVTIIAGNLAAEDQVGVTLSRIALVAGNDPTAKPTIIDVHIEYIKDKLGEAT